MLIVGFIPRSPGAIKNKDNTGSIFGITSHAAGCLNIFRSSLGLPGNSHQAQSWNVETDGDHICRQTDINGMFPDSTILISDSWISDSETCQTGSHLTAGNTACKFLISPDVTSVIPIFLFGRIPLMSKATLVHDIKMLINISPDPCGSLTKFPQTVVIAHIGPVRITIRLLSDLHGFCPVKQCRVQTYSCRCIRG